MDYIIVFYTLLVVVYALLIIIGALDLRASRVHPLDLQRKVAEKDPEATQEHERRKWLPGARAARRGVVLLLIAVLFGVAACAGLTGWLAATAGLLVLPFLVRLHSVKKVVRRLFLPHQEVIARFSQRAAVYVGLWREQSSTSVLPQSREALLQLVARSQAFSEAEKTKIQATLDFNQLTIGELMTPIASVKTVPETELLGPVTLDGLHKTGHTVFPVVAPDDKIVGILQAAQVMNVGQGTTITAGQAMDRALYFVHEAQPVEIVWQLSLRTHQTLFLVVDAEQAIIGIITIGTVLEAAFGKKETISAENFADVRSVAAYAATERTSTH